MISRTRLAGISCGVTITLTIFIPFLLFVFGRADCVMTFAEIFIGFMLGSFWAQYVSARILDFGCLICGAVVLAAQLLTLALP